MRKFILQKNVLTALRRYFWRKPTRTALSVACFNHQLECPVTAIENTFNISRDTINDAAGAGSFFLSPTNDFSSTDFTILSVQQKNDVKKPVIQRFSDPKTTAANPAIVVPLDRTQKQQTHPSSLITLTIMNYLKKFFRHSAFIAVGMFLLSSAAMAQTATISTDQADYPPGATVIITGTGFQAGEQVKLQVIHYLANGDNDTSAAHQPWYVTADANGNVNSSWVVPPDQDELGATLLLTADGQTSGLHAETTFTDALKTDTYPNSFGSFTGLTSFCKDAVATTIGINWSNTSCNGSTNGNNTNIPITIKWYSNTINSTSGGIEVKSTSTNAGTTSSTYIPSTAASGTLYYYVTISWGDGANCAIAGSITTSATKSITIVPSPTVFNVGFTGSLCGTAVVTLDGSETGVNYALQRNGSTVQTVAGTGNPISFTGVSQTGTYTVVATNTTTTCTSNMNGSVGVGGGTPPATFSVTGGGAYCSGESGVHVGLNGSETGVTYQLYNGVNTVGSPLNGIGSSLDFGLQTAAGTYTVVATKTTGGCTATMSGSATVTINALPNDVSGGFVGGAICYGANGSLTFDPNNSTFVTPYSIQYTDGTTTWSQTISSASGTTFNVAVAPTATTSYSLVSITNGNGCTTTSGFVDGTAQIIVRPQFTAGAINTTGETICYNTTPTTTIGSATVASGGDGTITYEWQSSVVGDFSDAVTINSNTATLNGVTIGNLTGTTTFRRLAHDGTCNTNFTASTGTWVVTVKTLSVAPTSATTSADNFCTDAGGTLDLTASGGTLGTGAVVKWYTGSCGGTLVGTGSPLTISKPTTITTYYALYDGDCNTTTCASVTVTVKTLSVAPTSASSSDDNFCADAGGTLDLTASGGTLGTGAVVKWYTSSCGGTLVGTGNPLTISKPTTTTTYYALYDGDCNTTTCASVTVTVKTLSVAPTSASSSDDNFCADAGGTLDLTASGGTLGTGAVVKWYTGSCGGTLVGTGSPLTISKPTTTTTYYALYDGDCNTTTCASVTVTVKTLSVAPTSASSSDYNFCGNAGGTLDLTASGGTLGTGAVVKWYSGTCGGTYVGTGNPLTINKPTVTTTYFARYEGDCNTTACASVTVNVKVVPHVTTGPAGQTITYGASASFTVAAEATGIQYQWQEYNGTTWSNITDGGIYSGAITDELDLSLPTVAMSGYQYRCVITGECSPSATSGAATLTVNKASTTTTLTLSAASVRYKDNLTLTAIIVPANTSSALTGSVTFTINGISYGTVTVVPIPDSTNGSVEAQIIVQENEVPGNYPVVATFTSTNNNYDGSSDTNSLIVRPRDASPFAADGNFYTGDVFGWTTSTTSNTATVLLAAVVKDNNTPAGDVRAAKVTFYYVNGPSSLTPIPGATNLPVNLVNISDGTLGTASVSVQLSIGSLNAASFHIAVGVSGAYTNNPYATSAQATVTVSKPIGTGFIVGGSQITNSISGINKTAGLLQGGTRQFTDYGFNVTYNKSGTNPKGQAWIMIRSWNKTDGTLDNKLHTYLVQSNAISTFTSALDKNGTGATATFTSKANLVEQMEDGTNVSVEGNANIQLIAYQNGCTQQIAVTVFRKAGGIWFANNWNGSKAQLQDVYGESTVYVSGANQNCGTSISNVRLQTLITDVQPDITKLETTVFPNPTQDYFSLRIKSPSVDEVQVKVFDILGKLAHQDRGSVYKVYQFGGQFVGGTYVIVVEQGDKRITTKVVKQ